MVDFKARRHRLELPPMPNTDDPVALKRAMDQMKRLVQDEFNRLSTDFYDFKKATYEAAVLPLPNVSNIQAAPTQYSVSATWENPDASDIVPTHVRVRINQISPNTWAEYTWPKSDWSFSGLEPGTQYTLEIQLVARFEATDTFVSTTRNCPSVPVLRTAESTIVKKVFTTDEGVGPPADNGTNDTNIVFNFPDTDGTPGSVGGSDCWWGYVFQYRTACAWADTAVSEAFAAGNVGDVTIDTGAVPFTTYPDTLFRLKYREICNGVAQDWQFGEPFLAVDYSLPDLGIADSTSLGTAPYSNADLFALPSAGQVDGDNATIIDELTAAEFLPLEPGFKCMEYIDGEWTLIADDTADTAIATSVYQALITGQITDVAALHDDSDFSFCFTINVPDNALYARGGLAPYSILNIGDRIRARITQLATTYILDVQVPRNGGGAYIFQSGPLSYAETNEIFYTQDTSEPTGRILYVNGTQVAASTNAIASAFDGISDAVRVYCVNDMTIKKIYGWNRALASSEIPQPELPVLDTFTYVSTGDITTGWGSSNHILKLDDNTLLISNVNGNGIGRVDITDRENPVLTHTLTPSGAGWNILYGSRWVPPGATHIFLSHFTTGPTYAHSKISTADLSVALTRLDNAYTGWSGTSPVQKLVQHQVDSDNYYASNVNTENYVNGSTGASAGAVTGGLFLSADGQEINYIPELDYGLGKRTATGAQPISLWDMSTPINPSSVTGVTFAAGNPGYAYAAYVDSTQIAIQSFIGGGRYIGLYDPVTGAEDDVVTGTSEVTDGGCRAYEGGGRKWVLHNGRTSGSDKYFVAREVVAGAFQPKQEFLMDASDGIFDPTSGDCFVVVDNYVYGAGKTGMVTYRIGAL